MIKNKIIIKSILIVVVTLLLLGSANAFAISAQYNEGNSLYILPGESKTVPFILQNLDGTSDLNIKVEITSGGEYVKIDGPSDIITVPAGDKAKVNLIMSVPEDAQPKEIFPVNLNFVTVSKGESGTFSLSGAITQRFNAIIGTGLPVEEPKPNYTFMVIIIAIALAIGVAFYSIAIRKKK